MAGEARQGKAWQGEARLGKARPGTADLWRRGMAAVMVERNPGRWYGWVPQGRGHELLERWAPYRRDAKRSTQPKDAAVMAWSEPLEKAFDGEPDWVVLVDRAVAELVKIDDIYDDLLKRFYLDRQALWELAPRLGRTEGFAAMRLQAACDHVNKKVARTVRLAS